MPPPIDLAPRGTRTRSGGLLACGTPMPPPSGLMPPSGLTPLAALALQTAAREL